VVGYHLEQAARYRRELRHADAALERHAALRLAEAGSKASMRSDAHGAANLLRRALALLPGDDPLRPRLLIELIGTVAGRAAPEEQFRLIDELEHSADPAARMHGRIARLQLNIMTDPVAVIPEAEAASEEALRVFAGVGDDLGLAHAYFLVAWINWLQSRAVPAAAAYQRVLEHARKANARSLLGQATIQQAGPLFRGPFTPEEVEARLEQVRRDDSALARTSVLMVEASLAERAGRFDDALALLDEAETLQRELGNELGLAITIQSHADVYLQRGEPHEAAAVYREALARLEALEMTSFRSTTLVQYAEALYACGEPEEAERLATEGEESGAAEDVVNFAWGRSLRARLAADRGDHERAEQLARDALEYAYATDFPSVHAAAHEALAHALAAAGGRDRARAELEQAHALWTRYGYRVDSERVEQLLVQL